MKILIPLVIILILIWLYSMMRANGKDEDMSNVDRCVCCGREIPEGSQYCIICGQKVKQKQRQIDCVRSMNIDEMAEFLCDNFDCDVCPAYDPNYCTIKTSQICSMAMKKYLETEVQK